jgi:hypothetical protein
MDRPVTPRGGGSMLNVYLSSQMLLPSRIFCHYILDNLVALIWVLKNVPIIRRNVLERSLEAFRIILLLDAHSGDVCDLSDKD